MYEHAHDCPRELAEAHGIERGTAVEEVGVAHAKGEVDRVRIKGEGVDQWLEFLGEQRNVRTACV